MTAFDLIDSIFSRAHLGMPANARRITGEQLAYLERLIGEDCAAAAYKPHGPGEMIWQPGGRHKYILTREGFGKPRSLTRLSNIAGSEMGMLF
jgi:hypothetical protein